MDIRRLAPGEEEIWRRAVELLIPVQERYGDLVSIEDLSQALTDSRCYLYVAQLGPEPLGILSAYRFSNVTAGGELVYLYDIVVGQKHRRGGIGRGLVDHLVRQCRIDRVRLVWAGTHVENSPARRLFERSGASLESEAYAEYEWKILHSRRSG